MGALDLGLGLKLAMPGAGGGGGGYNAKAVHFDGNTQLNRLSALVDAVDSPFGLLALWTKGADIFNNDDGSLMWATHAGNIQLVYDEFWSSGPSYVPQVGIPYVSGDGTVQWNNQLQMLLPTDWTLQLVSWDISRQDDNGNAIMQVFYGDTDVTNAATNIMSGGGTGVVAYSAATKWGSLTTNNWNLSTGPTDTKGPLGDIADYQFFIPEVFIDLTVSANRRKFIDGTGKPVDPATAALAFGSQIILHSGDAAHFATNQGTGGAFALTGTLTNATTSPSD